MSPRHLEILAAGLLSLGPGLVWFHYLRGLDTRRPEPLGRLLLVLAAGALSTQAVLATSEGAARLFPSASAPAPTALGALLYFVLWVGLVEEFWKLMAVRLAIHRPFDEPAQGLIYSGVAALGFATAENAVYILRLDDPSVLLQRWIMSTFGHVLMASFWGYGLGMTLAGPPPQRGRSLVLLGLALSALVHGLYDWLLVGGHGLLAVLLLLGLWRFLVSRAREAARLSPFRKPARRAVCQCPACRALVRGTDASGGSRLLPPLPGPGGPGSLLRGLRHGAGALGQAWRTLKRS